MPSESTHVGPIIFANETAREQLVERGEVITFRTDERTTGETWWRERRTGPKQGDVRVEWVADVCPHGTGMALQEYVELSGFGSVHEWQQAIRAENGRMPAEGELYRVTTLDETHRTCAECDGTIVTEDCILTEDDGSQLRVCADCGLHGVRWFTFDGEDVVAGPVYGVFDDG